MMPSGEIMPASPQGNPAILSPQRRNVDISASPRLSIPIAESYVIPEISVPMFNAQAITDRGNTVLARGWSALRSIASHAYAQLSGRPPIAYAVTGHIAANYKAKIQHRDRRNGAMDLYETVLNKIHDCFQMPL